MIAGLIDATFEDLDRRLRAQLAFRVASTDEIGGGSNSRLFRLASDDGREVLAKLYYRDGRRRLETEFAALSFLRSRGFADVPRVHFANEDLYYAVYSFEPGTTKRASDLTTAELTLIASFAADLHRIAPGEPGAEFPPAPAASFSIDACLRTIDARLRAFRDFAGSPAAYPEVRAFCADVDVRRTVTDLVAATTAGLGDDVLQRTLPPREWRLTTADLAPHNVLVRPDGTICVVDFEYFGWDDPARCVMGFVGHDASTGLSDEAAAAFLRAYRDARGLSDREHARFVTMRTLLEIEWLTIHLSAMTPAKVANKRFAAATFDLHTYLIGHVAKFERRVERARSRLRNQ